MRRRQFIASAPMVGLTPYVDRLPLFGHTGRTEAATPEAATTDVELTVDRWSVVPQVSSAPKLDGTLNDPAWQRSRPLDGFRTFYVHDRTTDEATVRLLHDGQRLYLGVRYAAEDAGASVVNFEALMSPHSVGGPFFRIPIAVRRVTPSYSNSWGPGVESPSDLPVATKQGVDAVTATAAIPFAAMGIDNVPAGTQWRFNLIVQHEMMTKPYSSWMPVRTSLNNYSGGNTASVQAEVTDEGRLGTIFLGKLPPADGGEPVDYWLPEEPVLKYLSYTEKELSFALAESGSGARIGLDWRTPTTDWEPVTNLRVEPVQARMKLTFEHPGPLDRGTYELRILVNLGSSTKLGIVSFDRNGMIRAGDAMFAN